MFIKNLYKIITAEFSYGTIYSFDLHSISSTPTESDIDLLIQSVSIGFSYYYANVPLSAHHVLCLSMVTCFIFSHA